MNQYPDSIEYPKYVESIKKHYGAAVYVLWYIVTETADRGADIAARALALLAPFPNAVSVYNISQHSLGYSQIQALAFAATLELALFAIIEVTLHMWDGWLKNNRRYTIPLSLAAVATVGVLAIVMTVVYSLEVKTGGHWVLALLPLVSLCAFIALGLKRWHERSSVQPAVQKSVQKSTVQQNVQPVHFVQMNTVQPLYTNGDIVHGLEHLDKREQIQAVADRMIESGMKMNKSHIAKVLNVSRTTVTEVLS